MQKQSRTTRQRTVILEALRSVTTHPTADEVYSMTKELLPRISLGTVYRNLDLLVQQGEIACLETASTQKRFDGNPVPHHHVRCKKCGKVADFYCDFPLPSLRELQAEGFTVTGVHVEFEGLCAVCGRPASEEFGG